MKAVLEGPRRVWDDFAGLCGDDSDVEVFDYEDDWGAGVGPADSDVVESSAASQGEFSEAVNLVVSDPVVRVWVAGWFGFWEGFVGGGWGSAADAAVGSVVVVDVDKLIEEGL